MTNESNIRLDRILNAVDYWGGSCVSLRMKLIARLFAYSIAYVGSPWHAARRRRYSSSWRACGLVLLPSMFAMRMRSCVRDADLRYTTGLPPDDVPGWVQPRMDAR